jgi:hypothetical protein
MSTELVSIVFAGIALFISVAGYWLNFRMRKKDFQIAVLKEQLRVGEGVVSAMLNYHDVIKKMYSKEFVQVLNNYGLETPPRAVLEQISLKLLARNAELHAQHYANLLTSCVYLPESVVQAALNFYESMGSLFSDQDYVKYSDIIYNECFDCITETIVCIRNEAGIDHLSIETRNLLKASNE